MKNSKPVRKSARIIIHKKGKRSVVKRAAILNVYNFSEIEDRPDAYTIIKKIAADAGHNAAKEAKALDIDRVYFKHGRLVKISSGGKEQKVTPKIKRSSFYVSYKPTIVLHAVKK